MRGRETGNAGSGEWGNGGRPGETARNTVASGKKTRGLGKWDGLGRGAKLLGDFASYLISPEILPHSTAFPAPPSAPPPLLWLFFSF
jgi:hypothetical protein